MIKCRGTNEADEMEQTFYLTKVVLEPNKSFEELKFVDEVTMKKTALQTYFRHPSLISKEFWDATYQKEIIKIVPFTLLRPTSIVEYIPQHHSITRIGPLLPI